MTNRLLYCIILLSLVFTSCKKKEFGELYKKQVYLIRSGLLDGDVQFGDKENETFISVYVSGTQLADQDVSASLDIDEQLVDSLNEAEKLAAGTGPAKEYTLLPSANFRIDSKNVIIRKGEQYGRMPFSIKTTALDPQKEYILPIVLIDASTYEIVPTQRSVLYHLVFNNAYSGEYSMTGTLGAENIGKQKSLKALSEFSLEMYADRVFEDTTNSKYLINIRINGDQSLTLTAPGMTLIQSGENSYNPATKTFMLNYSYTDPFDGSVKVVQERLQKML